MGSLLDLDFLFVVGKGGVGKTTTSAALALAAARQGKRVLLAMCNAKERLSHMLEVDPIGPYNQRALPNLDVVNMVPKIALEEYGLMVLKVKALYKAIFENRFATAFLRGTPGIEAWSMLGKAYFHTRETDANGARRYDLVILDAPATGHGLEMLRVPQVILDVAPPGLLRREAENALALFRDPKRAGALLVTLPEDMPANETVELHDALTQELRIPVQGLVINRLMKSLFSGAQADAIHRLSQAITSADAIAPLVQASSMRVGREQVQKESFEVLSSIGAPRVILPYLFTSEFRKRELDTLSHCFG